LNAILRVLHLHLAAASGSRTFPTVLQALMPQGCAHKRPLHKENSVRNHVKNLGAVSDINRD
jgi:hypothetical protein